MKKQKNKRNDGKKLEIVGNPFKYEMFSKVTTEKLIETTEFCYVNPIGVIKRTTIRYLGNGVVPNIFEVYIPGMRIKKDKNGEKSLIRLFSPE